jgi:hypothetical protein
VLVVGPTRTPRRGDERRTAARYAVWFPVQVDADDLGQVVGITRDASSKGMLLQTNGNLSVGAPVAVTFRVRAGGDPLQVDATVVRAADNDLGPWPYELALEFDEPLGYLEAPLRREARLAG